MIVRFESQWSTDQDRWAALDDIMRHEWKGERERQTKRGWWDEVAGKIDSFPQDPRVYHVHPYGWVDNFCMQRKRHPIISVCGLRQDLPFLLLYSGPDPDHDPYRYIAGAIGCEVAAIKAVAKVETGSIAGFFTPGKVHAPNDDFVPAILYERHIFHRLTDGKYDAIASEISSRTPYVKAAGEYGAPSDQYGRLLRAYELDSNAALKSASWGRFQIMGFNHADCGFGSVEEFVIFMSLSDRNHSEVLVRFLRSSRRLIGALLAKDWTAFAKAYNGKRSEGYDRKLKDAYDNYAQEN